MAHKLFLLVLVVFFPSFPRNPSTVGQSFTPLSGSGKEFCFCGPPVFTFSLACSLICNTTWGSLVKKVKIEKPLWMFLNEVLISIDPRSPCAIWSRNKLSLPLPLFSTCQRNPWSESQKTFICLSCFPFLPAVYNVTPLLKQPNEYCEAKHHRRPRMSEIHNIRITMSYSPRAFSQKSAPS